MLDLAAWLLKGKPGWSRARIDAEIATGKRTTDMRLARSIPVAWIYLTGWASPDGTINFRNDVYGLDPEPREPVHGVEVGRPVGATRARLRLRAAVGRCRSR